MSAADWISVEAAWDCIETQVQPLSIERVALEDAHGRVLAQEIRSDRDYPPFDRSAMDGFAVRSADVRGATAEQPIRLQIVGEATPGHAFESEVVSGSAVRIMTGAPVPSACDGVVPVEQTSGFEPRATHVLVHATVAVGQHVAPQGVERRAHDVVYVVGQRLDPADVGALAMLGASQLDVFRRPRVAVLSTGNELVPHTEVPTPTCIRNSNSPMLRALAQPYAHDVQVLGPAIDRRRELDALVARGLEADVLLLTGGVSMGAYDLVGAALAEAGVHIHFERVAVQPGKPVTFGTHAKGAVLALPGNPVSALTTFRLFGLAALRRAQGQTQVRPVWSSAAARFDWQRRNAKWLLLPGRLVGPAPAVERVRYTGSGDLLAYAAANCQIVLPPQVEQIAAGDSVGVWPL